MSNANPLQLLRSNTANKRPDPTALADGRPAINTNAVSPGLFFKDSAGSLVKVGPVHVGTTAPNASPASGGATGNSLGEQWLDTTGGVYVLKVWDGSAWRSETGTFVDASGDTMTGALVMDNQQQVRFREVTANGTNYIALQAPASIASDKTITLPDVNGTVVTTGDTGTVTSTMILDGTIVNADVNASAAIAGTKISPDFGSQTVQSTGIFSHALGSASAPTITFTGDTNTGIYSPGADQVAISTNGTRRLIILSDGKVGLGAASVLQQGSGVDGGSAAGVLELYSGGTGNTTLENTGAFPILFKTNGSERLRITSAGLVGVGTSSVNELLHIKAGSSTGLDPTVLIANGAPATSETASVDFGFNTQAADPDVLGRISTTITNRTSGAQASTLSFGVASSGSLATRMTLTGTGLGIGTTSPGYPLDVVSNTSAWGLNIRGRSADNIGYIRLSPNDGATTYAAIGTPAANTLGFDVNGSERLRIDSSGRLLVGTSTQYTSYYAATAGFGGRLFVAQSSYDATAQFQNWNNDPGLNSEGGAAIHLSRSKSGTVGTHTALADGNDIGALVFNASDGTNFRTAAVIKAACDGGVSTGDVPGRLVFSTTADGASSPTERMRIINNGAVLIGNTTQFSITSNTATGSVFGSDGTQVTFASAQPVAYFGRQTNDGTIVEFRQDGSVQGSISVSGTTVSYNGAHLSRWSQLLSGAERTEILRGTVLSNIDEMCEWGEENNEQLNRMKVSDVEGDKNVAGVFQAWDDDDDTYINDFYCAMTGDFIIRIGAGVTVERGDLLMSAGDGTAKPQDDDIIRSKTIAKVTSTNVSCTYDDGSYCVPCVLMAC